jgi:hypothetical protein
VTTQERNMGRGMSVMSAFVLAAVSSIYRQQAASSSSKIETKAKAGGERREGRGFLSKMVISNSVSYGMIVRRAVYRRFRLKLPSLILA